jgi:hypothetical protein
VGFDGRRPPDNLENYHLLVPGRKLDTIEPTEVVIRFVWPAPGATRNVEVYGDGSVKVIPPPTK